MIEGPTGAIHFPRVVVGGLTVAALDRKSTAELIIAAARWQRGSRQRSLFFTSTNGQVVSLCASDPEVRSLFAQADLISADGMSVVFASWLRPGVSLPERVATTDAFHDVARLAQKAGISFYFLGGTDEVNARAVRRVREIYPQIRIVGSRHGYFGLEEEPDIIAQINATAPDVLWVGLGVPQQQKFVLRNRNRLTSVGVTKTCGGLFDFLAGKNQRAPRWMQRIGLSWLYRTYEEPRRLVWRYLTTSPHAVYWLVRASRCASDGAIKAPAAADPTPKSLYSSPSLPPLVIGHKSGALSEQHPPAAKAAIPSH